MGRQYSNEKELRIITDGKGVMEGISYINVDTSTERGRGGMSQLGLVQLGRADLIS